MKNPDKFFSEIKAALFKGKFTQSQVNGINALLKVFTDHNVTDLRFQAYMLATVFHECAGKMIPIEEYGKGAGRDYGKQLKMGGGPNKRIPYAEPKQLYYGRGYVQLTWYENYQMMGRLLNVDLLNHPELALHLDIAAEILVEGMTKGASNFGDFTGKCLEQFFNDQVTDWVNARRIINGLDKADTIAGYAKTFYKALQDAA